ncbi:MAG: cytidylyltransferase domain-containing protein, partial [Candidatus Ratteibacteria bacterium]
DSKKIAEIGKKYGAIIIDRPPELCTKESLGEDVFAHGYRYIRDTSGKQIELMVLLFCNAPTILAGTIDKGIEALRKNPFADSAVSVSIYNMWSPLRARRLGEDGFLYPFVPFEIFGDVNKLSCDRDSQGDVYFADMGVSVVRPHCLENLKEGLLPQRWMGKKILPLLQWGGLDVDFEWQVPLVEFWLKKHGFTEEKTPYE